MSATPLPTATAPDTRPWLDQALVCLSCLGTGAGVDAKDCRLCGGTGIDPDALTLGEPDHDDREDGE